MKSPGSRGSQDDSQRGSCGNRRSPAPGTHKKLTPDTGLHQPILLVMRDCLAYEAEEDLNVNTGVASLVESVTRRRSRFWRRRAAGETLVSDKRCV